MITAFMRWSSSCSKTRQPPHGDERRADSRGGSRARPLERNHPQPAAQRSSRPVPGSRERLTFVASIVDERRPKNRVIQRQFRHPMLQPPILELQRLQVPGRIHVLGRMFGSPAIERADRNPVFPARTCDSSLGTSLPQDLQLSFFTESRRHPSTSPVQPTWVTAHILPRTRFGSLLSVMSVERASLMGDSYTAGKPGAHRLFVPFTPQDDG